MNQEERDRLWADRLRASYDDWHALWDFCETIKADEETKMVRGS